MSIVMQDTVRLIGSLDVVHWRRGQILREDHFRNLIVSAGKAGLASRSGGVGAEAAFTYIAIGTGAVAAAAGDTALGAEITTGGGGRAAATMTRQTTSVTNDTDQAVLTITFSSSFAVTELGRFNAASSGTMLARLVFSAYNVVSGDVLAFTHKVQFA